MTSPIKISLEKRTRSVQISLEKHNITKMPPVKVVSVFDVSGSMHGNFATDKSGSSRMQDTFDRMLAIAAKLDDDGTMEVYAFDTSAYRLADANLSDYGGYLAKNIEHNSRIGWGGTLYVPPIASIIRDYAPSSQVAVPDAEPVAVPEEAPSGIFGWAKKKLFGASVAESAPVIKSPPVNIPAHTAAPPTTEAVTPATVLFFTDGASSDADMCARLIDKAHKDNLPIYFHFVGVGSNQTSFAPLKYIASTLPNAGYVAMNDLSISDEELYASLISEKYANWLKSHANAK